MRRDMSLITLDFISNIIWGAPPRVSTLIFAPPPHMWLSWLPLLLLGLFVLFLRDSQQPEEQLHELRSLRFWRLNAKWRSRWAHQELSWATVPTETAKQNACVWTNFGYVKKKIMCANFWHWERRKFCFSNHDSASHGCSLLQQRGSGGQQQWNGYSLLEAGNHLCGSGSLHIHFCGHHG